MSDNATPIIERYATHRGEISIFDHPIRCFVLDDETRVLSGRGMTAAFGIRGRSTGISRISRNTKLRKYFPDGLAEELETPIVFRTSKAASIKPGYGYNPRLLRMICSAILDARDAGELSNEAELRYAEHADRLIRSLADVALVALIDEATGFQEERERDALEKLLRLYISEELLPWSRRFPPEFYEHVFRLKGWRYDPKSNKRPKLIGKVTSEIVYEKLPEGVLDELRRKNPANDRGNRSHRHHQYLTQDIGNTHLREHLLQVMTLMKVSTSWSQFMRHFVRAFPERSMGVQGELFAHEDDE